MGGAASRRKGHDFERLVAKRLRSIFPEARRGYQTRGGTVEAGDIEGTPFRIECKHSKSAPNIRAALSQAELAPGNGPPVAITKKTGERPLVTMDLEDWLVLVDHSYRTPEERFEAENQE